MSQYIVLNKVKVQNANCIAGFTWGFPAITNFLGFTHALQRKLSTEYDIKLSGCAVVCHDHQLHVYKPKKNADFEFIQSKNPPVLAKHKKSSPPIIEEGKMNVTLSIIIEVATVLTVTNDELKHFEKRVLATCLTNRLAGGTILDIGKIKLLSASTDDQEQALNRKIKKLMMPGFVLQDRSDYLQTHFECLKNKDPQAKLIDAWLDFSAIKHQAIPVEEDKNTPLTFETKANWNILKRPVSKGYLVPIMTGYKAISELFSAGEVEDTRDDLTPTRFVEAVHTIAEWKGIHRVTDINEMIWRYQGRKNNESDWYLCTQTKNEIKEEQSTNSENIITNFASALAQF
ncbi:type I-F CRISPR-associated protein Csy2 [Moritella sp. 5]|uniref:type I-F CRISPR-associated protein Csy2 n=1 Tax=Moritella sp. 5 TaxID=2746231 RepID=UPI001BA7E9CE|nr:type I-F CRISPR-associated protein Csy2 [Moritella sp. 5]QUM81130.1 type I-F CRISPR-associated protein Csy2 [Moritella sp. 5]